MKLLSVLIFLIFLYVVKTDQSTNKVDDHYVAAVVEYNPDSTNNTWEAYFDLVASLAEAKVDIIVFPETNPDVCKTWKVPFNGTLKTYPVPALRPELYDEPLVKISEAARQFSIYVVINLEEAVDCTGDNDEEYCPEKKNYVFNTNIVFDRHGAVILRYRKNHLFAEPNNTPSLNPGVMTFNTDFGVKFAVMICFDILHQVPLTQAIEQNVTNILVSADWVSEMPFLTGVQAPQSIAYGMDVNMIVSGYNDVSNYASGSGIYSGKGGALISFITGVPTTKVLVAKVPKDPGNGHKGEGPIKQNPAYFDGLATISDKSLKAHVTKQLKQGFQEINLSFNDIKCKFIVNMKDRGGEKSYKYRTGAFSGTRMIENYAKLGTQDCAVFFCKDDTIHSCGKRFIPYVDNSTAIFEELIIEATVPSCKNSTYGFDRTFYPTILDVSFLPLLPKDFVYSVKETGNFTVHKLSLTNVNAELYSFGLWGRLFEKDNEAVTPIDEQPDTPDVKDFIDKALEEFAKIGEKMKEDIDTDEDSIFLDYK